MVNLNSLILSGKETSLVFVTISDSVSVSFVNSIVTIDCFLVCMLKKQPLVKKTKTKIREVLFICFFYLFIY